MPIIAIEPPLWLLAQVFLFLLIFSRTVGFVILLPFLGGRLLPHQVRYFGVIVLAYFVFSINGNSSVQVPDNILIGSLLLGAEFLLGFFMSVVLLIFFSCLIMAGDIISRMSGFSMATQFDTSIEESIPILSQFYLFLGIVVFITTGGLESLLTGYLDSFEKLPPGLCLTIQWSWETIINILKNSTILALRLAMPVILASLTVFLTAGIMGRVVPQLNIMLVSFNVNTLLTLIVVMCSLGFGIHYFSNEIHTTLKFLFE